MRVIKRGVCKDRLARGCKILSFDFSPHFHDSVLFGAAIARDPRVGKTPPLVSTDDVSVLPVPLAEDAMGIPNAVTAAPASEKISGK